MARNIAIKNGIKNGISIYFKTMIDLSPKGNMILCGNQHCLGAIVYIGIYIHVLVGMQA